MSRRIRSPYELTIGGSLDDLHPVLRRYFGLVPPGWRGYGNGVFERVGTPRRWLRPVLQLLAGQAVLFPAWEANVPFTVVNAPLVDREGRTAVVAVRRFHLMSGVRTMVDAITAENPGPHGLVDHLGLDRRYRVRLSGRVVRGELHLESTAFELRIGRQHFAVPQIVAPRVHLVERYDDAANGGEGAQRVTVRVEAPFLGRLYEYTGVFSYELRPEQSTPDAATAPSTPDAATAASTSDAATAAGTPVASADGDPA